jgi:AcrR family transcriptional regulator
VVVFAGQGDPRRSMTLLWRDTAPAVARPGPRQALTVDGIVDAAIAVADEHGMGGLSMQRVADHFGRTAMSLYTYVPGKSELVDLMYDRAHRGLATEHPGPWRDGLGSWARELWARYLRHPWVLQVSQARPVLGPHEFAVLDAVVAILRPTGLPARVLWRVIGSLFQFVRGMAQTVSEARQAAAATGHTDDEWWYARSVLLGEVAPDFAERYPALAALDRDRAFDPVPDDPIPYLEREARDTFDTGLTILFAGIAATIEHDTGPRPAAGS